MLADKQEEAIRNAKVIILQMQNTPPALAESPTTLYLLVEELNDVLEALYMVYVDFRYLFLDEIQNIEEWFLFVNRLLRQNIRLVITGSNAKLLSSELSTHLTGRYNQIELFPSRSPNIAGSVRWTFRTSPRKIWHSRKPPSKSICIKAVSRNSSK